MRGRPIPLCAMRRRRRSNADRRNWVRSRTPGEAGADVADMRDPLRSGMRAAGTGMGARDRSSYRLVVAGILFQTPTAGSENQLYHMPTRALGGTGGRRSARFRQVDWRSGRVCGQADCSLSGYDSDAMHQHREKARCDKIAHRASVASCDRAAASCRDLRLDAAVAKSVSAPPAVTTNAAVDSESGPRPPTDRPACWCRPPCPSRFRRSCGEFAA